ncbi:MAG: PQQ-binding-like beta-propeller repeat protein, partial [Phycisphaerales bacterium]|nr:PQQ-binding-like beta-propeller repeat protein [Phycisphaerales bacterium]
HNSEPPVMIGDLLILAPPDSGERLALDRFTGQERWRVSRRDEPFVIGANEWGVFVAGERVVAIDESDGKSVRWRSASLEICGRPALRDEQLFVPTRAGLVVLDAKTGRIVADQWSPDEAVRAARAPSSANVAVSSSAVFCVSPNVAVRLADPDATNRAADEATARGGASRAHLARAWLSVLNGRHADALAAIQDITADDASAAAKDRLLSLVFMALSHESKDAAERLKWLEQARSLARSPETAARLALLIGRVLEESEQWRAAFEQYSEVLLRDSVPCATESEDAGWLVASDTLAAQRLAALLARPQITERGQFIDALMSAAAPLDLAGLRKIAEVMPPGPRRATLERLVLSRRPPPELSIGLLGAVNDASLDDVARRAALIDLWEVHTALGMYDSARNDADAIKALPVEPVTTTSTGTEAVTAEHEDQVRRIERIERSMRKLAAVREEPFKVELRFRWKLEGGRLLHDAAQPLAFSKPWILIHDQIKRQLVLCATRGGDRLRETHATPIAAPPPEANTPKQDIRAFWQPQDEDYADTPVATIVQEHLAAVAVPGGLVCVGLGPERRGGQRLWDRAIPEWSTLPENIETRVRGCSAGALVMPRPGRLFLARWIDGRIGWQRDLPGLTVSEWNVAGDRVLMLGDDGRLWSIRVDDGGDLKHSGIELGTITDMAVVNDHAVIWTERGMLGLDSEALSVRWIRPGVGVVNRSTVSGTNWVAVQPAGERPWVIVDAATGRDITSGGLEIEGKTLAWAADEKLIYAACELDTPEENARGRRLQSVSAYSRDTGARTWSFRFDGVNAINPTQLLGHPTLIPVLVEPGSSPGNQRGWSGLELQLINKVSGETTSPESIGKDFELRGQMRGHVDILVTVSRILVQCKGVLAAYGSSVSENVP